MTITTSKIEASDGVNKEKIQRVYEQVIKVFQKNKLTVKEILLVLGNVTYSLGASIGGYNEDNKGPTALKLQEMYLTNPTIDVVLMLSGLNFCNFINDLNKTIEDVKEELLIKKDNNENS